MRILHQIISTNPQFFYFWLFEPYQDPYGVLAEFEGVVGIVDADESKILIKLKQHLTRFIRRLPWASGSKEDENRGMVCSKSIGLTHQIS